VREELGARAAALARAVQTHFKGRVSCRECGALSFSVSVSVSACVCLSLLLCLPPSLSLSVSLSL
jgi:hypothetical protein